MSSQDLADTLYASLTSGEVFAIQEPDFSAEQFQVPSETDNPIYREINQLSLDEVTSGDGTGTFDRLMETITKRLDKQYEKGRMSGTEYAQVYVQLTQGAMNTAIQFAMQQEQQFWQSQIAKHQAQAAEIGVVRERTALETAKAEFARVRNEAKTVAVNYARAKMELPLADAQIAATKAQTNVADAELGRVNAQVDQINYQTDSIMPAQMRGIEKDTQVKEYQLSDVLPSQVENTTTDTQLKDFQLTNILPAQLESTREQMESYRSKTMDVRSDGSTPIKGSVGKQTDLYDQQITSYQRDSDSKYAKMLLDTWITQKSMDEGIKAPEVLRDSNINQVMYALREKLSLNTGNYPGT